MKSMQKSVLNSCFYISDQLYPVWNNQGGFDDEMYDSHAQCYKWIQVGWMQVFSLLK